MLVAGISSLGIAEVLITLQSIDDEKRDLRKGSEKEVKSTRKEPNGKKCPNTMKEEKSEVESDDATRRHRSLSSSSDSQDDVRQIARRKTSRASRSRARDRNEVRE